MQDARYVRLISWTLLSGSKQFIYNWNQTNTDLDQETGKRNGQGSNGKKWMGIQVVSKVTCKPSRQEKLDNGIKRMGIQVVARVTRKPSRQGKSWQRNKADRIQVLSRVTHKPSRQKILTTENGSLWLRMEARPQKRMKNDIAIKRTKEIGTRIYKCPKESKGQV
jgi:hypothetical protein